MTGFFTVSIIPTAAAAGLLCLLAPPHPKRGWRFHQSDLEAARRRGREEEWRPGAKRHWKDEVTLLYLSDHQVRHVRIDVPHSDHPTPTWQGESVGHYEGDTLVIDTIGQKVGPLLMVDRFGTPFSAALHVIERYRLIDGATARDLQLKHESTYFGAGRSSPPNNPYGRGDIDPDATKPGLQVEITVDDPAVFTTPWSGLVTYRHVQGEWPEAVCAENTYGSGTSSVSTSSSSTCIFSSCLVPEADQSDF